MDMDTMDTPMDTITPEMAQPYYDLFHDDTENEDFDGFESDEDHVWHRIEYYHRKFHGHSIALVKRNMRIFGKTFIERRCFRNRSLSTGVHYSIRINRFGDRVTNERVLERAQTSKELLKDIQKRQLTFLGHCIRKEKLEGHQRIKFLDTVKTALESTGSLTTIPEIFRSARNRQLWKNMVGKVWTQTSH
ncbi:hypothetical protein GQR58_010908 [Nymphon striatum]|nr:hypothetical protein GQR58_010908 [Nymphon striatum]